MLWYNKTTVESLPKWYARNCFFNGTVKENGAIDLSNANTQFKTGDAVIYMSNSPLTGMEDHTVYYLRRGKKFTYQVFATREEAVGEGEPTIIPTTVEGEHLFVEYDMPDTTNEGKERFTLYPVDIALAKKKLRGLYSPGWYRFREYTASSGKTRIKVEHLVSLRSMKIDNDRDPNVEIDQDSEDWVVNEPNTFTLRFDNVSSNVKANIKISNPEHVESIQYFATDLRYRSGGTWKDCVIEEDGSFLKNVALQPEMKFRMFFRYGEDEAESITFNETITVESVNDEFPTIQVNVSSTIENKPNNSTVEFCTVDTAIAQ